MSDERMANRFMKKKSGKRDGEILRLTFKKNKILEDDHVKSMRGSPCDVCIYEKVDDSGRGKRGMQRRLAIRSL